MKIKRTSTAIWTGTGKDGQGALTSQSGILSNTRFGFNSRFADGPGTNPEELIAAAHAGCFSMKLAFNLQAKGFKAQQLTTNCEIVLEDGNIIESNLILTAIVEGIDKNVFDELVNNAEAECPVSKLLAAKINLTYALNHA